MMGLVIALLLAAVVRVEGPENRVAYYRERVPVLLAEVEGGLGFTFDGEAVVRLARTDREFEELVGKRPRWVVAIARPRDRTLVVRLPAVGPALGTDVSSVLRHELVHLLLPARIGWEARTPLWFEEGLAQVLGGRVNRSDTAHVAVASGLGRLIPLSELETRFPESGAASGLAYAQGESVVTFLFEEGGRAGFHRLLDAIRETGSLDAALRRELGYGKSELERRWKDWLEEEESPWWLVLIAGSIISIVLFAASLLVVAAWFRARRRSKATYESLPD